ncbi:HAD-IIA family hydrolase [Pseudoclavibacter chungangensis]|uniref:HAD-IIA family hydrolase n=2 Tax=Pseudoclavibacter chungangensis TaxID=587635 RepID=A0A7J5BQ60_9MICO|nr:HAD-IIA family hydrolase [Pseudoclavibacter chungangensis]KAB1653292.1 HAD-IIA family hydrolase [Pseudoclavibacter chungangensis]NYJ66975.1 HAD superfamily hydrolase (TIGR01450 family) [Pseudoclavibacter chungangensis]
MGPAPLDGVDLLLADLDGVVYRGPGAVAHAVDTLNAIRASGVGVGYVTNNASRTDEQVAEHLRELGLTTQATDVVTSPQAALALLTERVPAGSLVLVVGGEGIVHELEAAGFRVTRSADDEPDAVVQGFAQDVGWVHLAEASFALVRDIPWIATNQDWTIPVARGIAPGNGTLVSAVHTAVQRLPIVAGKPERAIFDAAVARFGAAHPLMVGDRLDTDIKGARAAGIPSAVVLTGIDRAKALIAASPDERPDFILRDLRGLREPYPVVEVTSEPEHATARVGREQVSVVGVDVRIESAGRDELDLLRAACAAIAASEKLIYALRVPERLYSSEGDAR